MGKNHKKQSKANVFKLAGAKSLKKSKAKTVNLGLKNLKQKVKDIDAEFIEMSNEKPAPKGNAEKVQPLKKTIKPAPSQEEVAKTADEIIKMDL